MQSVIQQPKLRLSMIALACQLACFGASTAHAQSADTTAAPSNVAPATVTVTGKKVGMGLMVQEDAPKSRSTVTSEELAKQRPTGNAYDALTLLPAVNTYSYDSTGLFGGGLTMRGFNSDQIGATVNGVPVNDSGNFAVFPQEYVDQENTCSQFVTQGSTDVDSPQVGATGGNFGITTCDPEDTFRVRVMQTLGQLNLSKTYLRVDSGRFANDKAKAFVSVSNAQADKWKGLGKADRTHVDVGLNYDWDRFNYIHGSIGYNRAINNNFRSLTLKELANEGYYADYSSTYAGQAAASPGKASAAGPQAGTNQPAAYYKLALNPFENVIASAIGKFRLSENVDLKVVPYYWYGFGTGGVQQNTLKETNGLLNPATGTITGSKDLNGDGDALDTVSIYRGSLTRTQRPGVTTSVTYNVGDHQILGGIWYERATHRQTAPAELVNADGSVPDIWLRDNLITRPDGSLYQNRDWRTISTAYQAFLQDTVSLMDNKLVLNVGVRAPYIKRDFTNNASEGSNSQTSYNVSKTYSDVLPQLGARYRITNDDQIFTSLAKNMRAPNNFVLAPNNPPYVTVTNGVASIVKDVKPEVSWSLDVGYRHQTKAITTSLTAFYTDFKDRQATAIDPNTLTSLTTNVGKVKNKGVEFELGNTPVNGWSVYGSLGYLKTEMQDNLAVVAKTTNGTTVVGYAPTAGKEFSLSPKLKAGLSVSYETNAWYVRLKGRYTASQYATLVNDEQVPAYTLFDLDAAYQLPTFGMFKNPKLTLNLSNLFDRQYRNPSSGTGINTNDIVTPAGTFAGKAPTYYMGAPRFASVTLRVDF